MAATASTMLELGTPAPAFSLPDASTDKTVTLEDFAEYPALLVVFMCNHCPFVKHIRPTLAAFARDYQPKGLAVVGVSSNDIQAFPEDGPQKMAEEVKEAGYVFPYLFDADQSVAKAYKAACTPDFFLFDKERKLVYRGQFDDSRPGNGRPVTGKDMLAAVDAVLAGRPAPADQRPSLGCNIKWTAGNEPDYYG
ncbi:MAG: thioredoxin family protein [Gammaproteobacteria bacterium]|nr:thioredoxin family protein [Gammaproteobacteria bacterium]